MGKIFKKLIALLLGAVMGITSIVATAVTSVYYLYGEFPIVSVLVPDDGDATTDKKDALGDLNDYSLEDVLALFNKGIAAPENFTIADLEEKYGLNIVELLNSLGSEDKPLVDTTDSEFLNDLKSVSIFTLFSGEGMDRFLADLPVSVVLGFIPEDTILAKEERAKLRGYSVGQLMSTDELTGQLGVLSALSEIKLGGIIPQMFEKGEDGNYVAKEGNPNFLNLLANVEFGAITNVATGKTSFGDELVDGGFSSLGDLSVGDVVSTFVEGDAEIAKTLDGLFNGMTFDELFEKDATTGKNKFVLDKLLDNVKVGAVLGYVKDEEGDWCEKAEDGTAGKPVNGLLEKIASLDLTTLVHAFTEGGETADKIHKALLVFGDISVGDVFETLGYSQSEDGTWLKKDGAPVKSPLLTALFDISIKDIVGDADQKLSVDAVRNNIVNAISSSCEGLTVGEGLGELLGIELVDGKYVHTKGDKQGKEVNVFMQRLLSVELSNVVASLGGEKIDANNLLRVFEDALAGATVGDLLGAEYINGKWYSNEQPVSGFLSIVYDIDFLGVFSIIREAQSGKFSYAKVIESFLPEIEIGDIVTAITKVTVNTEGEEDVYFDKDGKALSSGLNTILNLKLWQVAAGFDANHPYNLKEVIKDITVGDALSLGKDQNGWLITADKYATGAIEDLLDYTLGDLIATEDKTMKDKVTATLKAVTVGDIFTLALGYNDAEGKFAKDKTAEDTNQFLKALCLWDSMSIGRVLDIVSGKEKLDMETLRTELNTAFGEVLFGEPWRGLLTEKDGDGLTFKALKEASGILDPIFSAKFSVYFNIIFDVIGGKSLDLVAILDSIYGDATLGDLIAPIVKIEKAENGIYETSKDKSLGEAITALLDTQIVATVDNFVNKEITDKIGNLFDNKIVNIDFMLGNYVETFLNLVYDEEKEWTKNGESVYAPLNKVLAINLYELVSTILDKEMTGTEKRDYFVDLFDGLTVGDLASIVVKGDTNKELLDDIIFPIVITDVINDVFAKTPILDIVKKYVGEIQVGHIVDLIVETNENGTASRSVADKQVWVKANGTEYESVLSNVFSVSVNDVFGWIETKPLNVKQIIDDVIGENSLADFADIFLDVATENVKRESGLDSVKINEKVLPAIVGDILKVEVGEILDWTGMKGNDMINAIVSGICSEITFGQYINDLVPAKENQTAIMDKEVFKNLKDKAVATFVADLLIAENKVTYLKGYLDGVYVGDIVTLTGLLKGADGNWTNKNDKEIASPIESLCDVTFDQLFAWLDEKPIDVKGIVNDVFGDDSIADFADIFLDVETENVKRENGLDSVKINGKVLPVIVGDILKVEVGQILDWTGKQGNDMINAIVSGICNQTTFGQYINDLVPAKENQTAIMDKEVFKNLKDKAVATFVADLLIAENKVTYLKGYLDGVYVGDIVTLTGLLKGADGNWTNKNDKEIASPIESLCDVTFDQLFAWLDEKPIDVKGIVNDVFGDDSIASFADIFLDVETENVKRENGLDSVKINGKVLPVIVGDILSVTVGDVLDWTGKQGNDMINAIVSGICNQTTFGQYINDLVPAKENQTAIMDKEVFKNLKDKAVATFVADLLIAENKGTYLKGYLDGVYVGDIVTLTGLVKGADGNWTNKNDQNLPDVLESVCDVTFDQIFGWFEEKPVDVKGIISDVVGRNSLAQFVGLFVQVENENRLCGLESVSIKGNVLPVIVGDILNVTVDEILGWTEKQGNDMINAIVSGICDKRTFEDYVKDLVTAKDGEEHIIEKEIFKNLKDKEVATFVADLLIAENKVTYLKGYLNGVYVGDVMALTGIVKGEAGNWTIKNKDGNETVAPALDSILDVTFDQIFGWLDEKPVDVKGIVNDVLGKNTIADVADIFLEIGYDKRESGLDSVSIGTNLLPAIVGDILNVEVGEILGWTDLKGNDLIIGATADVFGERKFDDYARDLKIKVLYEKDVFEKLNGEKVALFVEGIVTAGDKKEFIKGYFDEALVGNVVQVISSKVEIPEGKDAWCSDGKELPLIVNDLFNVRVLDIIDWIPTIGQKETISQIVHTVTGDKTVFVYVDNIAKKGINNSGLKGLLDIKISEAVDVVLGVNDVHVEPNITGTKVADYFLNITDKVLIGDFVKDKKGLTYNQEDGVWVDADGNELKGLTNTLYKQKSSIVIYLIAVLVKPELLRDAIKDMRVGDLIMKPYNNIKNLDSEMSGNKDDGYTVEGAYKEVMEEVANIKCVDVYTWIFEDKNFKDKIKEILFDRELGDILFDTIGTVVLKGNDKNNLGFNGYANENCDENGVYDIDGNFALVFERIYNINIQEMLDETKTKEGKDAFVEDLLDGLLVGDIAFDITRKLLNEKGNLGMDYTFAYVHREDISESGEYENKANLADVLNAVFNIEILEVKSALKEKDGLKTLLEDKLGGLLVGDFVFDLTRKVLNGKLNLGMTATLAYTNKNEGTKGKYENTGNFADVLDAVFNITVKEVLDATNKNNKDGVKTLIENKLGGLLVGDVAYDVTRKLFNAKGNLGMDYTFAYMNKREGTVDKYENKGNFADVLDAVFNITVKEVLDATDKNNKDGVKTLIENKLGGLLVGDVAYDVTRKLFNAKGNLGMDYTFAYMNKREGTVDKYENKGNFADVLDAVFNITVKEVLDATDKNNKDGVKNLIENKLGGLLVGDVAYDVTRKLFNAKGNLGMDYTFAYMNKREGTVDKYENKGNFADVLDTVFNITIKEVLDATDKNNKNGVKDLVETKFADLKVGDIAFDLVRKLFNKKYNLQMDGTHAYMNKDANDDEYVLSGNAAAVLGAVFNIKVMEVTKLKGAELNGYIYNTFNKLTLGDVAYDIFRKKLDQGFSCTATGFAYQFKEDNTLLQGKLAKAFRAVFAITLGDVYDLVTKKIKSGDFLIKHFGDLEIGNVAGPYLEKTLNKAFETEYVYDKENDYEITVSGNFAEVLNAIYDAKINKLLKASRDKKVGKFFFGTDGVIGSMPAGHIVGYLTKTKSLKKTFKYTEITHEYNGEWVISGAYEYPMDILCNDVKISDIYDGRKKIKDDVILKFFSDVTVGQLMGGSKIEDVWFKPNGEGIDSHGAKNVIMYAVYDLTLGEALKKDFDPTKVIEDIYAGELMGYYYCTQFKYSVNADSDYAFCDDTAHVDGVDGYHLHTEYDCEIKEEHVHEDFGKGWYQLKDGKYERVGAVENAVANLRLKAIIGGGFDMAEALKGVQLGEAMRLVKCTADDKCEVLKNDSTHVHSEGTWYKVTETAGVKTYTEEKVLVQKISNIDLHALFTEGLDLAETFQGTKVGDVLDYAHCYVDGDANRVCNHPDPAHVHTANDIWYVEKEEAGVKTWNIATPLERVMANVGMGEIVRGTFNMEQYLKDTGFKLGELMGYEKCTDDENCIVHQGNHTGVSASDKNVWYMLESGVYTKVTNKLAMVLADYTLKKIQTEGFSAVTVGDLFPEAYEAGSTNPLSLIPQTTVIDNIPNALKTAVENTTAGKLYEVGLLPFNNTTKTEMDIVFGELVIENQGTKPDRIADAYDNLAEDAYNSFIAPNPDNYAGGSADADYIKDYLTYQSQIGNKFWFGLKTNDLVNVLLHAI